jgi:hypothetical protein
MTAANPTPTADQLAAHDLLSELRTRIATQPLPYQYGIEARALESLWEIFGLARKAMKDHPGCADFSRITTRMLNVDLRPVTAKWHRAHNAGLLDSKDGANAFRADLAEVRKKLVAFSESLQAMAYANVAPDDLTPEVMLDAEIALCFEPLTFGIDTTAVGMSDCNKINASESLEVLAHRNKNSIAKAAGTDAVGLALSGGGIRSATFCLGVVQVLVARGLMKDFDYLSTVSGGGYTGSFITSRIGRGLSFESIGNPFGPDTASVRHVRQNAKYLSAVDLKQRWLMVVGTLAGLLLNWTAPLCVLAALAWLADLAAVRVSVDTWLSLALFAAVATAILILAYGGLLRFGVGIVRGTGLMASSAAVTVFALAIFGIEQGYLLFARLLNVHWSVSSVTAAAVVAGPAIIRYVPTFQKPAIKKNLFKVALFAAGIVVPLIALTCFYLLRTLGSLPQDSSVGVFNPLHYSDGSFLLLIVTAVSAAYSILILNVNLTGPHKLYRDRLASTFVNSAGDDPDLPLSSVNAMQGAPYHLINATINLPSSTSPVLRDRKGDFFLFSKCWSGAPAVGYAATKEWKMNGAEVDLATAMAISGAAASPHMGLGTKPTLSALMTMLNIRLGFWIGHPKKATVGPPGFMRLLREMTGSGMSEGSAWFNLSDGGHIENMGVYELLRRRCKFIVCVDGEADPESTFEGQMTLVRHAQIDFGIRIEPRLDEIRPDPKSRFSRTHSQLFRILYPATGDGRAKAVGLMLYLKLSLTGDEAELLKRYRFIHPDFPHQSTLDQFYDEEQFEAYRQLGVHVAEGTFSPALMTRNLLPSNVSEWFKQLAGNMLEPSRHD